uniref:Putative secreted protein n=1 Tax=Ixodes ricinus TaxID=34613 RepID=A0A0K8RB12_IXORI
MTDCWFGWITDWTCICWFGMDTCTMETPPPGLLNRQRLRRGGGNHVELLDLCRGGKYDRAVGAPLGRGDRHHSGGSRARARGRRRARAAAAATGDRGRRGHRGRALLHQDFHRLRISRLPKFCPSNP